MATVPGFPRVTPHDLRLTAASLAISGSANPKAVQTMLGHQSAVLTMDTSADLFPDDLELVQPRWARPGRPLWDVARTNCGLRQIKAPTRTAGQGL